MTLKQRKKLVKPDVILWWLSLKKKCIHISIWTLKTVHLLNSDDISTRRFSQCELQWIEYQIKPKTPHGMPQFNFYLLLPFFSTSFVHIRYELTHSHFAVLSIVVNNFHTQTQMHAHCNYRFLLNFIRSTQLICQKEWTDRNEKCGQTQNSPTSNCCRWPRIMKNCKDAKTVNVLMCMPSNSLTVYIVHIVCRDKERKKGQNQMSSPSMNVNTQRKFASSQSKYPFSVCVLARMLCALNTRRLFPQNVFHL